jgi:hypothetical protein
MCCFNCGSCDDSMVGGAVCGDLEMIWKEEVVDCLVVLSRRLSGETEENN